MGEGRGVASVWFGEHGLLGVLESGSASTTHNYSVSGTGSGLEWVRAFLHRVLGACHRTRLWGCDLGCWAFYRFGHHMSRMLCETRYPF